MTRKTPKPPKTYKTGVLMKSKAHDATLRGPRGWGRPTPAPDAKREEA